MTTTDELAPPSPSASYSYRLSIWLFTRLLGVVFAIAFVSLWVQIDGLVGPRGVWPARTYFRLLSQYAAGDFFDVPTIAWLGATTGDLHAICAIGTVASLLLAAGVVPGPSLVASWFLYLSLVNAGGPFLAFQWDALLLETSVMTAFVVPWRALLDTPLRAAEREPPIEGVFLLWFLVFRLMFSSGVVKLTSGDLTWRDLTALTFHYETQPLPTMLGYWAHQLPGGLHAVSTIAMYAIELVAPFLIFRPGLPRRTAAGIFIALMVLIAATGNYGFFNLLTIVLCVPLIDDTALRRLVPARSRPRLHPHAVDVEDKAFFAALASRTRSRAYRVLAALALGLAAFQLLLTLAGASWLPDSAREVLGRLGSFHSFNRYGLFAVMTTERPEIVIEGTADGETWIEYRFRHKPTALDEAPRWSQPHMPRLDWRMWFAALDDYQKSPWVMTFMHRLVAAEPGVLALLEHDPFDGRRPRHVRARLYKYRFTRPGELSESGAWWTRTGGALYAPVVSRPREADQ